MCFSWGTGMLAHSLNEECACGCATVSPLICRQVRASSLRGGRVGGALRMGNLRAGRPEFEGRSPAAGLGQSVETPLPHL